jgi:2-dehydropantoate 2-reductase
MEKEVIGMSQNEKVGRFIIYGAGGIGGVIGGHLAMAGRDVVLIGRPNHMNAVRQHGLKLIKPDGTHTISINTASSPAEIRFQTGDVVLLTMKTQDTEPALRNLHEAVEDIPVFCVQNGVRNEEFAARHFSRVYGVRINIGAVYINPGEVICRRDPPGWAIIGRYPAGVDNLAETVGEELRKAGLYVLVTPDVMPYKWGKLMSNLLNAVGAITNDSFSNTRKIIQATQFEATQILSEAGIRWLSEEQIRQAWPDFGAKPKASMKTEEQSSTWQSLARQQGSVETEYLNGEILRVAAKLGKTAPVNEKILAIVQEMAVKREKPGKYTTVELEKILGL